MCVDDRNRIMEHELEKKKHSSMCTCNMSTQNRSYVRFALYNMTWHFHHVKCNNFVTGAGERDGNDEIALLFKTQATLLHRKSSSEITSTDMSASIRPFCGLWVQDDTDQMRSSREQWRCTGQLSIRGPCWVKARILRVNRMSLSRAELWLCTEHRWHRK